MNAQAVRAGYIVLLVALVGGISAGAWFLNSPFAQTCQSARAARSSTDVRFVDTTQRTSLSLDMGQAAGKTAFTFTARDGSTYHGGPVQGIQSAQGGPLACAGFLRVTYSGAAVRIAGPSAGASARPTTVDVQLTALINLAHMTGVIQFSDQTHHTDFTTTTTAPPDMSHAVSVSTSAVVQQNWPQLYAMTSQATTAGMTEQQFDQAMAAQEQQDGTITAITPVSTPQITTDPTGITYFTVKEQVTTELDGATTESSVVAIYVLENGAWKLWFTQPA